MGWCPSLLLLLLLFASNFISILFRLHVVKKNPFNPLHEKYVGRTYQPDLLVLESSINFEKYA